MDRKAMYKLSYGLFVLTAREDEKDNGCIINTAIQAASEPNQLSICVNKANYTHDMIQRTGKFTVSVLSQKAQFELFKHFGFQSGRDTNKFEAFEQCARGTNGIYYITEGTNAYISVTVNKTEDLGSHTMFIGEITDMEVISNIPSATYDYYQNNIKPKPQEVGKTEDSQTIWRCRICGYEYVGEELPDDFICPLCKHPASDFEIEKKADNSPLTIADRKAHETITGYLNATPFPVLSEEGKHLPYTERCGWDSLWIVDPLDGTKEFIKRNGEFTVNIAWVSHSVPVMGVIYLPVKQELYFAEEHIGAYKLSGITSRGDVSLEELMASATRLPVESARDKFVIVASRSHLTPETESYIEEMKRQHAEVELVSSGSSIKICLVAEGKANVYPRFAPTMEWDTAAGHAIARAAGMEIYQAGKEEPLCYNKEDLLNPWFVVEPKRMKY